VLLLGPAWALSAKAHQTLLQILQKRQVVASCPAVLQKC
jgi:hypothetical protein